MNDAHQRGQPSGNTATDELHAALDAVVKKMAPLGGQRFLDELSELILEENQRRFLLISDRSQPLSETTRAAHSMKSSARIVGASALGEVAAEVESIGAAGEAGARARIDALLDVMHERLEELRDAFASLKRDHSGQ